MRLAGAAAQTDPFRVGWPGKSSMPKVSHCTCRGRPSADGVTATMYPKVWPTAPPMKKKRDGVFPRGSLNAVAIGMRLILSDCPGLLQSLQQSEIDSPEVGLCSVHYQFFSNRKATNQPRLILRTS